MKYLVELTPLGNYFFGGETTFGENEGKQDYFVKSNLMPQASSILGLMRYEVLRQNNLLSYNPRNEAILRRVQLLIGKKGFILNSPETCYGIIRKISPVFLADEDNYYTAMPLDSGIKVSSESIGRCCYTSGDLKSLTNLQGFDPKRYNNYLHWCGKDGASLHDVLNSGKNKKEEDIFTLVEQIGINKNDRKQNENEAFFKQQLVKLHPRLRFVFTVEIENTKGGSEKDLKFGAATTFSMLGGNRSMFKMKITPETTIDFLSYFENLKTPERLLLLSDAYLNETVRDKSSFIWGECENFRSIETKVDNAHSWKKPAKTNLFRLLSRGSVIYVERSSTFENEKLSNIGLNVFI